MMLDYFVEKKHLIQKRYMEFLKEKKLQLHIFNPLSDDFFSKMTVFGTNGKMIRGGLVILGNELYRDSADLNSVFNVAIAAEIMQSALLIHDDIMDNDDYRRNFPSMHKQFENDASKMKFSNAVHYGKALGICAGDICFFMAFELLEKTTENAVINSKLVSLWAKELVNVGFAQMQDVFHGFSDKNRDFDNIIQLYLYKTGRYSFSSPLLSGALLAEADFEQLQMLQNFGEAAGIAFQIKDDELGLFGNEAIVGKSIGSDLKENKKTFIRAALLKYASSNLLLRLLKRKNHTQTTIDQIKKIYEASGAKKYVNDTIDSYNSKAYEMIEKMNGNENSISVLKQLVDYNVMRVK